MLFLPGHLLHGGGGGGQICLVKYYINCLHIQGQGSLTTCITQQKVAPYFHMTRAELVGSISNSPREHTHKHKKISFKV